ncbi:MAG: ABC transporter permease subunit [Candidatus Rokuibacteriota bacterium]
MRNVVPPILVHGSLHMANALLAASVVSFLGLGVQPSTAEWGAMISGGRIFLVAMSTPCVTGSTPASAARYRRRLRPSARLEG